MGVLAAIGRRMPTFARAGRWIASAFGGAVRKAMSFPGYETSGFGGGGPSGPGKRQVREWLQVYAKNSRIRGPVDCRAQDVANVKVHLYRHGVDRGNPFDRTEIFDHPILKLLQRPNPFHTWKVFVKLGFVYLEMGGRFPCWIERDPRTGRPRYLWPIPPYDLKKRPKPGAPWWEFKLNGKRMKAPVRDVLYISYVDPLDPYGWGLGRACGVSDEVAQDSYASLWNSNFFRQGAHVGKVVSVPGLDAKSGPKLREDFEANHSGINNAHRPFFVGTQGGPVGVVELGASHKDLDFIPGKKHLRDTMAQCWTVPLELVGVNESSNRATIDKAINIHQRRNVLYDIDFLVEQLNIHIVSEWGDETLYLESDNPVQETQQFILDQTTKGLVSGAVTVNEWRIKNGMQPKSGWDVYLIPVNLQVVDQSGRVLASGGGAVPETLLRPQKPPDEVAEDIEFDPEDSVALVQLLRELAAA